MQSCCWTFKALARGLLTRSAVPIWLTLAAPMAGGQETTGLLQSRLAQLAAASEDIERRLPNFACRETLVSQEVRAGRVKTEVHAAGDLRIVREPDGKLDEHFEATERDGKPTGGKRLKLPLFVLGGFGHALDTFSAATQKCMRFHLAGNRLDFQSVAPVEPNCRQHAGVTGYALLDPEGNIMHIERQVEASAAREMKAAPFGVIELSRVQLGGSVFSLSTHVEAEMPKGDSDLRWRADYSACRLFHVSVTMRPAITEGEGPKSPEQRLR